VTASWLAAPGLTVKDVDVTDRAGEATANDSVWAAARSIRRLVKVATPATAATLAVPAKVPPPLATVAVTVAVLAVLFPCASRISMTGWVVKAAPLVAPAGAVVTTSWLGAPAVRVTLCVAAVSPAALKVRV
jgi:hypothetical protein